MNKVYLNLPFLKKFDDDTSNGAELQTMISGIKLYKRLGFWHIFIESDSELVVRSMTKKLCNAWYLWNY